MTTLKQKIKECKNIEEKIEILREVNISGADLRGVNLSGSNLSGVNLLGADLRGAELGIFGKWNISFCENNIKIGFIKMTKDEWDLFFAGNYEFEIKMGTYDLFTIENNYRWFCEMLKYWPNEFGVKEVEK